MTSTLKGILVACILSIFSLSAYAQNTVVVIPMAGDASPLQNVITVAKKNGDFSDPHIAVESITDASASNPYLVVIAPGVYSLTNTLTMKSWVSISGSGQGITTLTGAISADSAGSNASLLTITTDNADIRDLTIENTGGDGSYSYGMTIFGNIAPRISNVTINMTDGRQQAGIWTSNSSPIISNSEVTTTNGRGVQWGIYVSRGAPVISESTFKVSGGDLLQTGVWGIDTKLTVFNSTIDVSDGTTSQYGIDLTRSPLTISDSSMIISGAGAGSQTGIRIQSRTTVQPSTISTTVIQLLDGSGTQAGLYKSGESQDMVADTAISISGSATQYGIRVSPGVDDFSSLAISNALIQVSGGSTQYGVYHDNNDAYALIRDSRISAATYSVRAFYGGLSKETYISDSILTGSVLGSPKCSFVFTSSGVQLEEDCSLPP